MRLNHHRGGSGEHLVLIHGIGSQWQVWEPVLSRVEAERDVIALDLPGFGASPPPPPDTPAGVPSLTSLVAEFLQGKLGLERPHVAGNSLGGWIALELAKRGTVSSATALSPAGFQSRGEGRYGHASLWIANRSARVLAVPRRDRHRNDLRPRRGAGSIRRPPLAPSRFRCGRRDPLARRRRLV